MTSVKLVILGLALVSGRATSEDKFVELFRWNIIEPEWPSEEARTRAYESNEYIPKNNPLVGIKVWKDKMYLTVPRVRSGVPMSLGVISATPVGGVVGPKLEAYPSWEMQTIGDCKAFQYIQGMEIDVQGRMWVLDSGRTEILTPEAKARCPPRLVILDLENDGHVIRSHQFPPHVSPPNTSFLNDIVLDYEDGGVAYITDTASNDPGIIVYSLLNQTSWKIRDSSMWAERDAVNFTVGNVNVTMPFNVDGIALSPASATERYVFYTAVSSLDVYSLPTWVLKRPDVDARKYVRKWGKKSSQTDGMMMASNYLLYYGLLAHDSIARSNASENSGLFTKSKFDVVSHDPRARWPDGFSFDQNGYLYCVTNNLQNILVDRVNTSVTNYRVLRMKTNSKSYQYYDNSNNSPPLPVIDNDVNC